MRTVAIWQSLDADAGAWLRESFVLRVGRDFIAQPLPDQRCQMRPQACFANAAYIVRHAKGQSLRYCEGFAMGLAHHHVFHHAWAVDGDNRVIDATLSDPTKYEFFGYPMSMRERAKWVTRLNNSVMMDGFGVNVDFLLKHCPSLI
jgi:hypothetical protein